MITDKKHFFLESVKKIKVLSYLQCNLYCQIFVNRERKRNEVIVRHVFLAKGQGLGDTLQNRIWPFYGLSNQASALILCSNRVEPLMASAGNCVRICPPCKQPWASCCQQY